MSTKRLFCYAMGAAPLIAAALMATAGPAAAHVTVQPGEATKGSFAKIAFRVPNESDSAGTIKLEVTFPADTPIASVRTKPTPGWIAERRTEKLATPIESHGSQITEAVRTVTWTAQPGVRIGPGEFTEFEVSLGRLPEDVDRLVIPAVQTYDDGEVVRWEQPPPVEGGEEPEHPAPVLELVGEQASGASNNQGQSGDQQAGSAAGQAQPQAVGRDETARWLAGAGLVAGALGLGLGVGAVLAGRRRARVE
jgi:periplasmic copper chaperone A